MAAVPNNERRLAANSNGPVQAVSKLLVKQARLTHVLSSGSLCDSASCITSGAATPIPRPNAGVEDCLELCRLLLEKVGADAHTDNSSELDRVLKTEYPPRVAELLGRITDTLDTNRILDSVSDVTDSSDDETIPESPGTCEKVSNVDFLLRTSDGKKPLQATTPESDVAYKSETEIAIGRIFALGKFKAVQDASIPANAPYNGPSVITMTGFGELGRYGNQLLQYAFLRCYASLHNIAEIQVPAWVGSGLFGLHNRPVMRALPPVVEFEGTLANSTFTDDLIRYVKNSDTSNEIGELNNRCLANGSAGSAPRNVDIWGWFQWHSSAYRPFKALIRDTFRPVPAIESHLRSVFSREVRFRGGRKRTVVGLHLRYGDYQNIAASSFGYCAPTSWYLEWLDKHWQTFEDPVLIVASDDLKAVLRDFAKYSPLTTDSIGMIMPEEFQYLKAGFFPDWYSLTQCDVLAISNSTFSFTATMMNSRPHLKVYRAHYALKMTEVDPWNADPIIHRDTSKSGVSQAVETLQILYNTQGVSAVLRNVMYELPFYGIRSLIMKAVLWRQARNTAVVVN